MRKITIPLIFLFTSLSFFLGCKEESLDNLFVPRLLVEARGVDYGTTSGSTVTLPVSGTTIQIQGDPVVSEFEITNVEMVKVDMGIALLVQVSGKGMRDLYRASVSNMGGRIVLTINGNAIGARRIDGAIDNGNFYTFVEVDDAELAQLVVDVKKTIAHIQEKKK